MEDLNKTILKYLIILWFVILSNYCVANNSEKDLDFKIEKSMIDIVNHKLIREEYYKILIQSIMKVRELNFIKSKFEIDQKLKQIDQEIFAFEKVVNFSSNYFDKLYVNQALKDLNKDKKVFNDALGILSKAYANYCSSETMAVYSQIYSSKYLTKEPVINHLIDFDYGLNPNFRLSVSLKYRYGDEGADLDINPEVDYDSSSEYIEAAKSVGMAMIIGGYGSPVTILGGIVLAGAFTAENEEINKKYEKIDKKINKAVIKIKEENRNNTLYLENKSSEIILKTCENSQIFLRESDFDTIKQSYDENKIKIDEKEIEINKNFEALTKKSIEGLEEDIKTTLNKIKDVDEYFKLYVAHINKKFSIENHVNLEIYSLLSSLQNESDPFVQKKIKALADVLISTIDPELTSIWVDKINNISITSGQNEVEQKIVQEKLNDYFYLNIELLNRSNVSTYMKQLLRGKLISRDYEISFNKVKEAQSEYDCFKDKIENNIESSLNRLRCYQTMIKDIKLKIEVEEEFNSATFYDCISSKVMEIQPKLFQGVLEKGSKSVLNEGIFDNESKVKCELFLDRDLNIGEDILTQYIIYKSLIFQKILKKEDLIDKLKEILKEVR